MSAKLEITPGLEVWRSSSVMAAVYESVAAKIREPRTQRWLSDVASRPAPFLDLSLPGLPSESRVEFVSAVKVALVDELRPAVKAALKEIEEAIRRAECRDADYAKRSIDGIPEDVDQMWGA